MSRSRFGALAVAMAAVVLSGCGRKDAPVRPERGERPDPAVTVPMGADPEETTPQDDDPLIEPLPDPVTPGPRLEERVDETLAG